MPSAGSGQVSREKQHWDDLVEALQREAESVCGYGDVVIRVSYYDGLPTQVDVLERRSCYRLGKTRPPLTGTGIRHRMPSTE
jgi:hypothetical protein